LSGDQQTKQKALELLLQLADARRAAIEDVRLRQVLSDELVAEVFEIAWKRQWDKSDNALLRDVRPIVDDAVARAVTSSENQSD